MLKLNRILLTLFVITVISIGIMGVIPSQAASQTIPGQYIVVLNDNAPSPQSVANDMAKEHGFKVLHVYNNAIKGFAIQVQNDNALNKIQRNPNVSFIEQDQVVEAFIQVIPTGINRIDADLGVPGFGSAASVAADIAIIDTGIDLTHPDLNVVSDVSFVGTSTGGGDDDGHGSSVAGTSTGDDDNGHGSHVAGIAAALDNDIGVVGVAPGANLWAVKVLDSSGSGSLSGVIAGIDYVTANAKLIDAANMSLGCKCKTRAGDIAINNSVSAGVTYSVAAGNSASNAKAFWPASNNNVITVSAFGDTDGKCGGLGPLTSYDTADDSFAHFSNYGDAVDIAAPGVDILSTWKDGSYNTISGTSMSSPHVAGSSAVYISNNPDATPADVKIALISSGVQQSATCDISLNDGNGGFSGDPDSSAEPLVYLEKTSTGVPPQVTITTPTNGAVVSGSVSIEAEAFDLDGSVVQVEFFVDGVSIDVDNDGLNGWSTSWDTITTAASDGTHSISATATDTDANKASDNISVIVDNVDDPPTVSITNPKNGDTVSGSVIISADALDDRGVNKVEFFVDGVSIGIGLIGLDDGWSISWDTTTVTDTDYTLKATATDSANQPSSDSIIVTVSNTSPTTVGVDSITYSTEGGKDSKKHLFITTHVTDNLGNEISGASVSIELVNGDNSWTATGTTGSTGVASFTLKNSPSGTYTTTITDVTASGLTWDGTTPLNSFEKLSSSTRNQNSILTS